MRVGMILYAYIDKRIFVLLSLRLLVSLNLSRMVTSSLSIFLINA